MELSIQVVQYAFDVLFGPSHRRKTARVLAGERFGASLEKENKEIPADEGFECRSYTAYNLRYGLIRPWC